jgi:hypothetical protein
LDAQELFRSLPPEARAGLHRNEFEELLADIAERVDTAAGGGGGDRRGAALRRLLARDSRVGEHVKEVEEVSCLPAP